MKTKVTKMRKVGLFFQALKRKVKVNFEGFTKHEPIVKAEAIEKTLYLLRRDFDISEQNDIVLTLIQRLHDKRESDLIKLEKELNFMREETQKLKDKILLTN
jgi:hypothetical protein